MGFATPPPTSAGLLTVTSEITNACVQRIGAIYAARADDVPVAIYAARADDVLRGGHRDALRAVSTKPTHRFGVPETNTPRPLIAVRGLRATRIALSPGISKLTFVGIGPSLFLTAHRIDGGLTALPPFSGSPVMDCKRAAPGFGPRGNRAGGGCQFVRTCSFGRV